MTYKTEEEILAANLPYAQKQKAILELASSLLLSEQLGTPKGMTQEELKKINAKIIAEEKFHTLNSYRTKIAEEYATKQTIPKTKAINEKITNYLTVSKDRQISGVASDFIPRFLKSNETDIDKAFKEYKLKAPKINGDVYHASLEHTIKQTIKTLHTKLKGITPFRDYKLGGMIGQVGLGEGEKLSLSLNALYSEKKNKAVLFTGKETTEKALAKSAAQIFDTYEKLDSLQYVTPTGTIPFTRKVGSKIISGQSKDRLALDKTRYDSEIKQLVRVKALADNAREYIRYGAGSPNYSSLDASVNLHNKNQARAELKTRNKFGSLVGLAVKSMGSSVSTDRVNSVLDMKVKELKNYGSQFTAYKDLQAWTSHDEFLVRDIITNPELSGLTKISEDSIRKQRGLTRRQALNEALNEAKDLGIGKDVVLKETADHLAYMSKEDKQKKAKGMLFDRNVGNIINYLKESKQQIKVLHGGFEGVSKKFPLRAEFAEVYAKEPKKAVQTLLNNINNHNFLQKAGLLEESTINPLLNLQGKIQVRAMDQINKGLIRKAGYGQNSMGKIDDTFLTVLTENQQLLGKKGLDEVLELHTSNALENRFGQYRKKKWQKPKNKTKLTQALYHKGGATDLLQSFEDTILEKAEELDTHSKLYDSQAGGADYLNSQKIMTGEAFYHDGHNTQGMSTIKAKDEAEALEARKDYLKARGLDADTDLEMDNLKTVKRPNMNEYWFNPSKGVTTETGDKITNFRNLQELRRQQKLSPEDSLRLHQAFTLFNGSSALSDKEMLLGLAGLEYDYQNKEGLLETPKTWTKGTTSAVKPVRVEGNRSNVKNVWVQASKYLKNPDTFGLGTSMLNDLAELGFYDIGSDSQSINAGKLMGQNVSILTDGKERKRINKILLDYVNPEGKEKEMSPGQLAVYSKLVTGKAMITNRERSFAEAIKKDAAAETEHKKLEASGVTYDKYKSKLDRGVIIDSLIASQGIGYEQYVERKKPGEELFTTPVKTILNDTTAQNLNKATNNINYVNDPKFKALVDRKIIAGDAKNILDPDNFNDNRDRLNNILRALDNSELDIDTKKRIKFTGLELLSKYKSAMGGKDQNPVKALALSDALDSYSSDIGLVIQPRYEHDGQSVKDKRRAIDGRFLRFGKSVDGLAVEGNQAIDSYYTPSMKKLVKNTTAKIPEGIHFTAGQEVTEDYKKGQNVKGNEAIAGLYGDPFYETTGSKYKMASIYFDSFNQLERAREPGKTQKTIVKHSVQDKQPPSRIPFFRGLSGFAARVHKPKNLNTFSRFPKDEKFLDPLMLSNGAKIPGDGHKDEVPALLTKGETVIDKYTSKKLGIHTQSDYERFKQAVAEGTTRFFGEGGVVRIDGKFYDEETGEEVSASEARKRGERDLLGKSVGDLDVDKKVSTQKTFTLDEAKVREYKNLDESKAERTNTADIAGKMRQRNTSLRSMPMNNIDMSRLQGQLDSGKFTNAETKAMFNLNSLAGMKDSGINQEQSIDELMASDSILSRDEATQLKKMTRTSTEVDNIKARTQSRHVNLYGQLLNKTAEQISNDFKNPSRANKMMNALTSNETILGAEHKKTFAIAKQHVLKALVPDIDALTKEFEGGDIKTLGEYSKTGQNAIAGLKTDPEKMSQFQKLSPGMAKTFDIDSSISQLDKSIKNLDNNMESFNKLFKTNFDNPRNQADLMAMVKKIGSVDTGFKLLRGSESAADMKEMQHYLKNLSSSIDTDKKGGLQEQIKLDEMSDQIGSARHLKESSKMRWSNFSDLMVQNAAFGSSYAVIGGITAAVAGGASFVTGLDERLHNLQAITGATGHELDQMAKSVKLVSTETKFSANEIADAATILGQAGFNAQDIKQSLGGVVKLATATGSALEDATQTLTSALTIWDAPMRDSAKYADQFTAAINQSKLDIKSLSLALQYTGNIAAQGGIPVEDVVTLTSLMKDSGIKQGSTVGTGQRLVTSDILAPSAKFTKALASVGISKRDMSDTFEDGGVIKVLKLMRDEGFGFGQATRGMEVRERSAYMAMINQIDKAELFRANMMVPGSADVANETQMKAFNNRLKNMVNSWGIGLDEMVNQRTTTLGNILEALTYSPKDNETHPFDTAINVYDQISNPTNKAGLGDNLSLAIGTGAIGFGATKAWGYLGKQDSITKKAILNSLNPRAPRAVSSRFSTTPGLNMAVKPQGALKTTGFNPLKYAKMGKTLPTVALGALAAQTAFSDDPWYATLAKELPTTALSIGGGALGGLATGGSLPGIMAGAVGAPALFEGAVGDWWNSFIDSTFGLKEPTKMDLLENVNTRYASAASTSNDLSKYVFQLRDPRSHLRYGEDATDSEKSLARLATKGQGRVLNEQFKTDIDFLEKETGTKFDFSMVKGTKDKQIADVLADKIDEFQDAFTEVIFERAEGMLEHLKDADKPQEFKTKTADTTLNQVTSQFRSMVSDMAEARPEVLMAKFEELIAVRKGMTKEALEHIKEVDPGMTTFHNIPGSSVRVAKSGISSAQLESAKDKEADDLESLRQTVLTAHDSAKNIKALDAIVLETEKLIADGTIYANEVDDLREAQQGKRLRLTKSETGIDRWETKVAELEASVAKIDESYTKFFKAVSKKGGEQIANLSLTGGMGNVKAAIEISNAFKNLGSEYKESGLDILTGKNKGFYTYRNKSATDEDVELGALEHYAKNMGIDFKGGLARNGEAFAKMQMKAISLGEKSVEGFQLPMQKSTITDPYLMQGYIARDRKFEDMGFNSGMSEVLQGMDLNSMSVPEALVGPLSNIEQLKENLNPVFKQQQEIAKEFKIKEMDIQFARFKNAKIGEGDGPFDDETSERGRAQTKRQKAYDRAVDANDRQVDFQMEKAGINFVRSMEKLEAQMEFQRSEMAINFGNQQAAMARQYEFNVGMANIQYGWKESDIVTSTGYKTEDLGTKTARAIQDLNTSISRKLEDTNKGFDRQIKAINLGFKRQVDSLERSRQDTLDFFDRSMERPTNIKLNPEAFMKIANVMDDNTLAIDAHKAELAMNTTSIQQLVAIQTSKEDIVKEAYKYAYKGVGGEVYKEDGTLNSDFTVMYEDYLARNNESLLDSVLDNALGATLSGGAFNINQALTDSNYMAAQVLDPSTSMTTEMTATGSGYLTEELINALIGESPGEIRLTTTQGIVLNAQGDLAGAIFDLETQMMKYDIQLREAGIGFQNALKDAALQLDYALEDLNTSAAQSMIDINLALARGMEDITLNHSRAMEQAAINHERNLETMSMQYQFQVQEAAIKFQQALEALERQEAFNKEQMKKGLEEILEDIANNAEFKLGEMAINNEINQNLINEQFSLLIQNAQLAKEDNIEFLNTQMDTLIQKLHLDAQLMADVFNRGLKRATMDKRINMALVIAEIVRSMDSSLKEMELQWKGLSKGIEKSIEKLMTDPKWIKAFEDAGKGLADIMQKALKNAGSTNLKKMSDEYDKIIIKNFEDSNKKIGDSKAASERALATKIAAAMENTKKLLSGTLKNYDFMNEKAGDAVANLGNIHVAASTHAVSVAREMQRSLAAILELQRQVTGAANFSSGSTSSSGAGGTFDPNSHSEGIVLAGYGGGDIIPAMLEPGEAVIRKEAVAALGKDYFEGLNNKTAGSIISRPKELTTGLVSLPSNTLSGSNVNNDFSIGISVSADTTVESIESNMERIADGVKRVFEEYV